MGYNNKLIFEWTNEFIGRRPILAVLPPFEYSFGLGWTIKIESIYKTDLGTIPWPLDSIFPPAGPYGPATVIHDYVCDNENIIPRTLAAAIFWCAMRDIRIVRKGKLKRIPFLNRALLYCGVRSYVILVRPIMRRIR